MPSSSPWKVGSRVFAWYDADACWYDCYVWKASEDGKSFKVCEWTDKELRSPPHWQIKDMCMMRVFTDGPLPNDIPGLIL